MKRIPFVSVAVSVLSFVAVAVVHAQSSAPATITPPDGARIFARVTAATPVRLADGQVGYAYRVIRRGMDGGIATLTVVEPGAGRLYHPGDLVWAVYDQESVSLLSPSERYARLGAERHATNNGR